MFARARYRIGMVRRAAGLTLVCVVVLAAFRPAALGAPSTSATSAAAAIAAQNAALQADFGTQVADFVAITRELHRTEAEVDQVTREVAENKAQIEKSAFRTRIARRRDIPQLRFEPA